MNQLFQKFICTLFLLEAADANAFLSLTFCDLHFSFLEIDSGCTIKGMYFISLVTVRL
jgi:hypothetical protein